MRAVYLEAIGLNGAVLVIVVQALFATVLWILPPAAESGKEETALEEAAPSC